MERNRLLTDIFKFLIISIVVNSTYSLRFPINTFFNVTPPQQELAHYLCHEFDDVHLGNGKCCDCTTDCMKYKSCCIDYLWNQNITQDLSTYIEIFLNQSKMYPDVSCEPAAPYSIKGIGTELISMITECGTSEKLCSFSNKMSPSNILPVIGMDGYIYRNQFCAECNNASYQHIELQAECRNKRTSQNLEDKTISSINKLSSFFEECFLSIHRNNDGVDKLVKTCQKNKCHSKNENYDLCRSYKGSMNNYQNYHCYKCDTGNSKQLNLMASSSCTLACRNGICTPPIPNKPYDYDWYFILIKKDQNLAIKNVRRKFPIREFFNIPSSYIRKENEGFEQFLCNGTSTSKCCSCRSDCMKTKSCCIDYLWKEREQKSLSEYKDMFLKEAKLYKNVRCEYVMPDAISYGHSSAAYIMVSTCLDGASSENKEKCEGRVHLASLPVLGSDNHLYKNKYCAKCNNVTEFRLITIQGGCKEIVNTSLTKKAKTLKDFRKCHFAIQEANWVKPYLKNCTVQLWPVRNVTRTNPNYDLCYAYLGKMGLYANYHCLLATAASSTPVLNGTICKEEKPSEIIHYLTWSLVIATNSFTSSSDGNTVTTECKTGEVYSIIQGKCVSFTCGNGFTQVGDKCVKETYESKFSNITDPAFIKCFEALQPSLFLTYPSNINLMNFISQEHRILGLKYKSVTKAYVGQNQTTVEFKLTNFSELYISSISNNLRNSPNSNFGIINNLDLSSVSDPPVSTTHGLDFARSYPLKRLCNQPVQIPVNSSFNNDCSVAHNGSVTSRDELSYWINIKPNQTQYFLSTCKKYYLNSNCKQEILPIEKTTINGEQKLVYKSLHHSYSFHVSQYQPVIGGFKVCISSLPAQWNEDAVIAEVYITIIGICISICCYVFIITTFLKFKVLIENVPGLCAVALCCCLLFSDTLFLIATLLTFENTHVTGFCIAVAILTHYALLVGNVWTVLIAYNIASKFFGFQVTQNIVKISKRKEFKRYCMIAFGIPLFAVVLCIILEYTDVLDAGYGKDDFCMIRGLYARYIFYLIPAACIFFINILFLLYTTFKVRGENKEHEEAIGNSGRTKINIAPIVLRLIMIFGVTEVIGFIHIPFPYETLNQNQLIFNTVFALLYSLLRSLRGLFLFFAYICRPQVIQLYKKYSRDHSSNSLGKDNFAMEDVEKK